MSINAAQVTFSLLSLITLITSHNSNAAHTTNKSVAVLKAAPSNFVASLSLGPNFTSAGETQTFFLKPAIQKSYQALKQSHSILNAELFLAMQGYLNSRYQTQLGLALTGTSDTYLNGNIWEDTDPDFNNFTYRYKINHQRIALKGKVIADMGKIVQPYLGASAGIGFNRAHDFSITPKIFDEVPPPGFGGHTQSAFSYTLIAGVQKAINEHVQAGIGYEFADWGKSHLAKAPGQTLNSGLALSHLYTNGLQLSLTYIA